ncbi:hypothetical protein NY65_03830 [Xanthomonas phaseoli pv. phaseoli]|nr:hypothetical protein NY68_19890 [Xanthomonas citri pv. fuscans]KGP32597.1 hypothetical protein NY65_03830 [Xanthomonas phaseoli pv. phaseoli]KGP35687.1 hypothetical protein NY64_08470 [Xanthomonas citri pv. fuscans]KKY05097.1 hypothetical protein NY67_22045 [Xanthomonas citri pv. fuscans]
MITDPPYNLIRNALLRLRSSLMSDTKLQILAHDIIFAFLQRQSLMHKPIIDFGIDVKGVHRIAWLRHIQSS